MDMTKNQTNLYPLGRDKEIVKETFLKDNTIMSLLIPDYNTLPSSTDMNALINQHIYKTVSIDNSQGDSRAYICIDTYIPSVENSSIKEIGLIINVFCHDSLIECSNTDKARFTKFGLFGNRIDMLIDAIDRCLNGMRGIGLGKLRLNPRNPIKIYQPTNNYYGKSLEYVVYDFNDIPLV